jgi:hypothetical protein
MPGFLLHSTAMVRCAHAGTATPTATFPKVLVSGQPIVLVTAPYQVAGCSMPPPPGGNGPCVMGKFSIASTKVLAKGFPVLLQDSQALCVPTGTPLRVGVTQTRVSGI